MRRSAGTCPPPPRLLPTHYSLTARLARTEEAAKKLLTARDPTLRGPGAGKLLAAQQRVLHLEHQHQRMQLQLARYVKATVSIVRDRLQQVSTTEP